MKCIFCGGQRLTVVDRVVSQPDLYRCGACLQQFYEEPAGEEPAGDPETPEAGADEAGEGEGETGPD